MHACVEAQVGPRGTYCRRIIVWDKAFMRTVPVRSGRAGHVLELLDAELPPSYVQSTSVPHGNWFLILRMEYLGPWVREDHGYDGLGVLYSPSLTSLPFIGSLH